MSMILDALKRSREDGDVPNAVPSIDTSHEFSVKAAAPSFGFKALALSTGLVVVVGFSVVVIQDSSQTFAVANPQQNKMQPSGTPQAATDPLGTPIRNTSEALPALPISEMTPRTVRAEMQNQAKPTTKNSVPDNTRVAALYRGVERQPGEGSDVPASIAASNLAAASEDSTFTGLDVQPSTRPPSPTTDTTAIAETPLGASLTAAQGNLAPDNVAEGDVSGTLPLDIAAVVKRVQAELGKPALIAHSTPLIENLSQQKKNAIPSVMYTVHDWRPDGSSQVTLNGTVLGVGQQRSGLKVEEILADSVILSYLGTAFRLRALNSWVNL